ncbi:MAG: ATP-dependent DNA helicase, partial [Bosea sp. (in: a-proteobacteria)]
STPGWQRAQAAKAAAPKAQATPAGRWGGDGGSFGNRSQRNAPKQIDGEHIATSSGPTSDFGVGARVFHIKFGPGDVFAVDGNKLTVDFDKAGRKMVLDAFVQRGGTQ